MAESAQRISDTAVRNATGKTWQEWLLLLEIAGAAEQPRTTIVDIIQTEHGVSPWWRQAIATYYERARQRKAVGETLGAGLEMGAQLTLAIGQAELWALLFSRRALPIWLGASGDFELHEGAPYTPIDGTHGTIRVLNPPSQIRLTWQPQDWPTSSTCKYVSSAASAPCCASTTSACPTRPPVSRCASTGSPSCASSQM